MQINTKVIQKNRWLTLASDDKIRIKDKKRVSAYQSEWTLR